MLSIASAFKRICLLMVLGAGLAIASLEYKQPANCQQLCIQAPCQPGEVVPASSGQASPYPSFLMN